MPRLMIAHPSADLYGSDLQLLETVVAVRGAGWEVLVTVPEQGALVPRLTAAGARVVVQQFPVLRRATMSPRGLVGYAVAGVRAILAGRRALRRSRPDVLLVNTVTVPTWLVSARLARIPAVSHVHEAEDSSGRTVRRLLAAPLFLAHQVVANSHATARTLTDVLPALGRRLAVVHNGVPDPGPAPSDPRIRRSGDPAAVVIVGRLSPHKGIDVALETVALLRREGRDVRLEVCGSAFRGYEWYVAELEERAARPDLSGAVTFHGYVSPTRRVLEGADVVVAPSWRESFGNAAVESLLACRPLVAAATQGLVEVVDDGRTGLLVPAGDAEAFARAVAKLLDDPERAAQMARAGRADAVARFGTARYGSQMLAVLRSAAGPGRGGPVGPVPAAPAARPARAPGARPRVHVAVPTFRRNELLEPLLGMLVPHVVGSATLADRTEIVIVDNDPAGGARDVVASVAARTDVPVRYVHEPRPGIAAVRARAIDEASRDGLVVFIDDDGAPGEHWIAPLVETWERTGAEAVAGRIVPGFVGEPSPWSVAGKFFERPAPATGTVRRSAPSGNLLVDVAGVTALGVAFDAGVGMRGGEDTLFTRGITEAGGRVVACAESVVVDLVPPERDTRRWVVARVYGHANRSVDVDLAFTSGRGSRARLRAASAARGAVVTVRGAARWTSARFTRDLVTDAAAWRDLARGPGLVAGALGIRHEAYRRS